MAQAVVVLLTPDDVAYLRHEYASGDGDPETSPTPQATPNVFFEAGMAVGHHPAFKPSSPAPALSDVIGCQKDHDRLRHLKAASGACPMYGLPDPVALSSCSIRLVEPNSSEPTGARRSHS